MSTQFALKAAPSRERLTGAGIALLVSACAALGAACHIDNPGVTPPEREINYPLVLAMSEASGEGEAPGWLYVVNTNYNIRYNSGSLQSIDLEAVDSALMRSCAELPDPSTGILPPRERCRNAGGEVEDGQCCLVCLDVAQSVLCDGRDDEILRACCHEDLDGQYRFIPNGGEVRIPSFGSGVELSSSGDNLYVSVRSNDTLLKVGVDGRGRLQCGQGGDRKCAESAYVGARPPLADTEAQFSPLPLGLVVGKPEDFGVTDDVPEMGAEGSGMPRPAELIVIGHDDGSVSLFEDRGEQPSLLATLDEVLPGRPSSMRLDPHSGMVFISQENREEVGVQQVARIGIIKTDESDDTGGYAPYLTSPLTLTGLRDNSSSRDVAFDPVVASHLYAIVRGRATDTRSLYFLETDSTTPLEARTVDAERVGRGPARIVQADIAGSSYLFVSCYDDRIVYIFKADTRQTVAFIRDLVGPFELEVDAARERAYVADFATSTVRVVDLRGLTDPDLPKPRIVLTLGTPRTERGEL